jgi:cell fate regulator YaaT (PSP1 superfamily)
LAELLEVRFKGNRKAFYTWENPTPPSLGDTVVVEVERGVDVGQVSAVGDAAKKKCGVGCNGCAIATAPKEPSGKALRVATADDTRQAADLRVSEDEVRRKVMERARHHQLDMKVSDAEWQFDRKKLTIYFTAEERVDFRSLVRDLASQFRTRIELRQIGARDEAKRLDGVGRCGRQYCCSSWLPELRPVSLSLAKDQRLSLNPSQISGGCGRLLCCLRYEHEFYVASRKRFPKEGKELRTARGTEKVLAVDIFRERLLLRAEDGTARTISLAELRVELPPDAVVVAEPTTAPGPAAPPRPPSDGPSAQRPAEAEPRRKRRRRRHGRRRKGGGPPGPDSPSPPAPPEGPGGG